MSMDEITRSLLAFAAVISSSDMRILKSDFQDTCFSAFPVSYTISPLVYQ